MKNSLFKLILLLSLVLTLVFSFASCEALVFGGNDDSTENGVNDTDGPSDESSDNGNSENDSANSGTPEHTHSFSEWLTTKSSTCTEKGELARVCMSCFEREVKPLDKIDHEFLNLKCKSCGLPECSAKLDAFDYSKIPAYSDKEYVILNENVPFFKESEKVTESYETYGSFDSFGRCTAAVACIGTDIMPDGPRGSNPSFNPTGWVQAEYRFISGNYLYNRCHLIAWQLSAETTNRQNIMTGTRYMNEAMIPFENMIAKYIKETDNHVMFRATPIFIGDNLLANGLLIEAYSVEDEGDGICLNLFFYNVQPGVKIDYATGSSSASTLSSFDSYIGGGYETAAVTARLEGFNENGCDVYCRDAVIVLFADEWLIGQKRAITKEFVTLI